MVKHNYVFDDQPPVLNPSTYRREMKTVTFVPVLTPRFMGGLALWFLLVFFAGYVLLVA